jgi:hypothetical protein
LANAIRVALDDPELRARIGAAGRQRVISRWTWRHTAEGTIEQYRALLDETGDVQSRRPGGASSAPRFAHPSPTSSSSTSSPSTGSPSTGSPSTGSTTTQTGT